MEEYFSDWGPREGPILYRDRPPALGVFRAGGRVPVGVAFPTGHVPYGKAIAATFRLQVDGVDPSSRFVCVGRRFVEMGEAAA